MLIEKTNCGSFNLVFDDPGSYASDDTAHSHDQSGQAFYDVLHSNIEGYESILVCSAGNVKGAIVIDEQELLSHLLDGQPKALGTQRVGLTSAYSMRCAFHRYSFDFVLQLLQLAVQ